MLRYEAVGIGVATEFIHVNRTQLRLLRTGPLAVQHSALAADRSTELVEPVATPAVELVQKAAPELIRQNLHVR